MDKKYNYLLSEDMPKMIKEGVRLLGTKETLGGANNATIIEWAKELGGNVDDIYTADSIPWCGLFVGILAKRAGKEVVKDPLWALNWGTFGVATKTLLIGDVLTFVRKTADGKKAGHVALYIGEDKTHYHVIGGNQSDSVTITRMPRERLYAARRPQYTTMPKGCINKVLDAVGGVSDSEA